MNEIIKEQQDEFTFKKFFGLIKRSGKRILIYGLIAAVVGLCLAAVIAVATMGNEEYRGALEYTHKGIIDGRDPNGNVLDYNRIKSSAVIDSALRSMGYTEEEITSLSDRLEGSVYVEPYLSPAIVKQMETDPAFTFNATRYGVVVIPDKGTGMTKTQYTVFVNELIKAYIEYFKSAYGYSIDAPMTIGADSVATAVDYYDLIYAYSNEIEALKASVNALPDAYAATATKLTAKINILAGYVTELETYILTHNVRKQGASMTLAANLDSKIAEFTTKAAAYKLQSDSLDEPIAKYQQMFDSVVVGDNTITISSADATAYNALVTEKKNAVKLQAQYDSGAKTLSAKKTLIGDGTATAEDDAYVRSRFDTLYANLTATVSAINADLADYASDAVMNAGVKIVNSGYRVRKISYTASIVAFAVTVVAGVFAAVIVTSVKEKRAGMKKEEKPETAESPAAE